MARQMPHRKVTIELPLEDWMRLDRHAAASGTSKNAVVTGWLAPMLQVLRANPPAPKDELVNDPA